MGAALRSAAGGLLSAGLLALVLAGCGTAIDRAAPAPACAMGTERPTVAQLFFGRSIPDGGTVSEEEWQAFVTGEVAKHFPQGWTVTDGAGGWWDDETKTTIREPAKVLTLVLFDPAAELPRAEALRTAYIERFRQQSVGLVLTQGCAGF